MSRSWWKGLIAVAVIVTIVFALLPLGRLYRLMQLGEVPLRSVLDVEAQGSWYDLLKYTDGCEWAVLRMKEDFVPPAHWCTDAYRSDALPETFHMAFTQSLPLNPQWTAWYYVPVDKTLPFDEQEWFAAFYNAAECLLALYRGCALYGMP